MIRLYSIGLFLFISLHASAAKLIVEDSLIVKEVDNKTVNQSFLSQTTTFELTPGEHAVVLKYKDVYEDLDFGQEELVESAFFVAKFSSNDEGVITIKTPKISNLKVAKHYVKMPKVIVIDSNSNALSVEHQTYSEYKTEQEVSTVLAYMVKTKPAEIKTSPVQLAEKTMTKAIIASKVRKVLSKIETTTPEAKSMNNLLMLKYWWKQASKAEKNLFKQQIKVK